MSSLITGLSALFAPMKIDAASRDSTDVDDAASNAVDDDAGLEAVDDDVDALVSSATFVGS